MVKNSFYQKNNIFTFFTPTLKAALPIIILVASIFTPQILSAPTRQQRHPKFAAKKIHTPSRAPKIIAQKKIARKPTPRRAVSDEAMRRRAASNKARPRQLAAKNAQLIAQREKQIQADGQMARRLQAEEAQAARAERDRKAAIRAMAAQQAQKNYENKWRQPTQPVRQNAQRRQAATRPEVMSPPHVCQFQNPPSRHDQYSCGAAAVQMALKMLARQGIINETEIPTFDELVDILNIKRNKCAYSTDITHYLSNSLHLNCITMHQQNRKIIDNLDTIINNSRTIPTIALSYYGKNRAERFGHFVLVWDNGEDNRYVTVCDPAKNNQKTSYIPRNAFMQTCDAIIQITGRNYQN